MKAETLKEVRKTRFKETIKAFAANTGLAERTVRRMERGEAPIPLVVGFAIAARLYGLPPWGFGDPGKGQEDESV